MSKNSAPNKGASTKPFRYRNHVACNPLLKKGGVHEKTNGAKRGAAKRKLKKEAMNWKSDSSLSHFIRKVNLILCVSSPNPLGG